MPKQWINSENEKNWYGMIERRQVRRSRPTVAVYYFKIFSNFAQFCPNFEIFCPFQIFLCLFSEKSFTWRYLHLSQLWQFWLAYKWVIKIATAVSVDKAEINHNSVKIYILIKEQIIESLWALFLFPKKIELDFELGSWWSCFCPSRVPKEQSW